MVDRKLVEAPSKFTAGRSKAALLFWFFGDFRCGVLLFIVILVIYKYRNRYKWMLNVRLAGDYAVAGDVFDGVFLCCPFSQEMSWMRPWT